MLLSSHPANCGSYTASSSLGNKIVQHFTKPDKQKRELTNKGRSVVKRKGLWEKFRKVADIDAGTI